jgi:uncharacterized membrane protein SpoIIM required for sporulation
MREVAFLQKNRRKWDEFEELLVKKAKADPDRLAALYIEVTDDLSYARTHFPHSKTLQYLNELAVKIHNRIYANKKESASSIWLFFYTDMPLAVYKLRWYLLASIVLTCLFVAVGVLSAHHDESYVRLILGDNYVNMTQENIANGDPLGVYRDPNKWTMFLEIYWNNFRVLLNFFALGLTLGIGTFYVTFTNGVMLGSFHYMLFENGVLTESLYTVYIHGAIEIPYFIIGGGAGFALGLSMLFPGTLSRVRAFSNAALSGTRIILGLQPLVLLAAVVESFVTRYYQTSVVLNVLIVLVELSFMVFYFGYYPFLVARREANRTQRLPKKSALNNYIPDTSQLD